MIDIKVKYFDELTISELYNILQLRSEVFVVEQNCVYQDIDGKDSKALHIIGFKNDKIVAYTRIFKPGDCFKEAGIGRVVVRENERKHGCGNDIMKASIRAIEENFSKSTIYLSAQTYLVKFYGSLGFNVVGEEYLEDNILHIDMVKNTLADFS